MGWIVFICVFAFIWYAEFGGSYEERMNRIYKRTSEDVNWNRNRCSKCGK